MTDFFSLFFLYLSPITFFSLSLYLSPIIRDRLDGKEKKTTDECMNAYIHFNESSHPFIFCLYHMLNTI